MGKFIGQQLVLLLFLEKVVFANLFLSLHLGEARFSFFDLSGYALEFSFDVLLAVTAIFNESEILFLLGLYRNVFIVQAVEGLFFLLVLTFLRSSPQCIQFLAFLLDAGLQFGQVVFQGFNFFGQVF